MNEKTVIQELAEFLKARAEALEAKAKSEVTQHMSNSEVLEEIAKEFRSIGARVVAQLKARGLHVPAPRAQAPAEAPAAPADGKP
jgi:hypothetical protein